MSGTGPLPYLTYCGVEVANAARTVEYIRNGLMRSAGGQIELGSGDLCGVLYRVASGEPRNYCTNPSFETSTAGWTIFPSTGTATLTRVVTDAAREGSTVGRVDFTPSSGGGCFVYQDDSTYATDGVPTVPGNQVLLQMSAYLLSGTASMFTLYARVFDSGGLLTRQEPLLTIDGPLTGNWYDLAAVYTAQAGDAYVMLELVVNVLGSSLTQVYVDRCRISRYAAPAVFVSPAADPAPWYDPTEPGSTSFLGLVMLGIKGYDSTITRSVTNRITGLGGGTFGGQHRVPRTWSFRAAMISSDDVGAEYGLRWLTSILQQGCDGCAACELAVRLACPPANGSNDDLGKWSSYDVALTDGPHEVEPFINQYGDGDNLAGCRDVVIVEWTMQAGNPFLYKQPELCLSVDIDAAPTCASLDAMAVTGEPITDAMRALGVQGDGLPDTDSSYGLYRDATNHLLYGGAARGATSTSINWLGSGAVLSNVLTEYKFGTSSARAVAPGLAPDEGFQIFTPGSYIGAPPLNATNPLIASIWLKGAVGGEQLSIELLVSNTDGATSSTSGVQNITLTTEWQRFQTFALVTSGKAADYAFLQVGTRTGATLAYTAYADGAQIEVGVTNVARWATPYINTIGAAATRASSYVTGDARVLDETVGWAAFRVRLNWKRGDDAIVDAQLLFWQDDANNWIKVAIASGNNLRLERRAAGVTGIASVTLPTFVNGDTLVLIASWSATALKVSVNGAAFTTVADTHIPALAAATYTIGNSLYGDVLWFGASSEETLSDADAAEIYALAATDPILDDFSMPTGAPLLKGVTWPASTTEVEAAVAISICDWLFGPVRNRSYCPVTPPARGAIAPVYTITSEDGIGGLAFESYEVCPTGANGRLTDDPVARLEISGVPAGATVVVDAARQTVTIIENGVTTDGLYLVVLEAGRGLQWPQARYCDAVTCFTVGTLSCTTGSASVQIDTQAREG